jgi:hypothetical protein
MSIQYPVLFTQENHNNLYELADFLQVLSPLKFDFFNWTNDICCTVGCAVGWASTLQTFKDKGLIISENRTPVKV